MKRIAFKKKHVYDRTRFDQRQYSRSVETGRAMTGEKTKFSRNDFGWFGFEHRPLFRFSCGRNGRIGSFVFG